MNDTQATQHVDIYGSGGDVEDQLFGKWFPRIGALAIIVGAGFGFRYAIDQGWIGARLRIMLGLLASFALIAIGDWTRSRGWRIYASAITGGGVGLLYITLWASVGIYDLVPASVAFFSLVGVSALGVGLALRHESQALALISVLGGFSNTFVTGLVTDMPQSLYLYILAIDLAVVALGFFRPWRLLQQVAFVGSWVVFEIGQGPLGVSLVAATGVFVMFGVVPYLRAALGRDNPIDNLAFVPANALIYYLAVVVRLEGDLAVYQGPFTLAMAVLFTSAFVFLRVKKVNDEWLGTSTGLMSLIFLTLWSPIQLGVDQAALGWAMQALVLLGLHVASGDQRFRTAGWILLAMAGTTHLVLLASGSNAAAAVVEGYGRYTFMLLIAGLYLAASIEHSNGRSDQGMLSGVAAGALTLLWLSLEVYSVISRQGTIAAPEADLHLALSGTWALYAGALLSAGIYLRNQPVRLMSLALFGGIVTKMAVYDLWLLDTLQRLVGFVGLGVLLLACSLMYHRFRPWFATEPNAGAGA